MTFDDPSKREAYILKNVPLVHYFIHKIFSTYKLTPEEYDDYVSVGTLGLIDSIDRFDPSQNVRFVTFAYHYIVGYCKRYRRDNFPVKLSCNMWNAAYGSHPELVEFLSPEEKQNYQSIPELVSSLDYTLDESYDPIINPSDPQATEAFLIVELQDALDTFRAQHPQRSDQIFADYLQSIMDQNKITQNQLADKYGVTQTHVCRCIKRGIKKYSKSFLT